MSTSICTCKFPLIIVDERDGKEIEYFAMPIETIQDGSGGFDDSSLPDMEVVEAESLTGIIGTYMKVVWKEPHSGTSKYDVHGHVVVAGCPEDALECDAKNIYVVYHPIEEWIDHHIVELKKQ